MQKDFSRLLIKTQLGNQEVGQQILGGLFVCFLITALASLEGLLKKKKLGFFFFLKYKLQIHFFLAELEL